jgi:hypothetical protein
MIRIINFFNNTELDSFKNAFKNNLVSQIVIPKSEPVAICDQLNKVSRYK